MSLTCHAENFIELVRDIIVSLKIEMDDRVISYKDIMLDTMSARLLNKDQNLILPSTPFFILKTLLNKPENLVTIEELMNSDIRDKKSQIKELYVQILQN